VISYKIEKLESERKKMLDWFKITTQYYYEILRDTNFIFFDFTTILNKSNKPLIAEKLSLCMFTKFRFSPSV